MPVLSVVVDDATFARLRAISVERDGVSPGEAEYSRRIEMLAENAVSEAALDYFRNRNIADDPGRKVQERST